jgi:phage N-6-adenine-methyltransferase
MPPEKYEAKIARQLALAEKAASATGKAANPRSEFSGEFEWYTPAKYIDLARQVMGGIDLDPASSDAAQTVVQAEKYFTIKDDGLTKEWHGRVFINPPYKQPAIIHFVKRLTDQVTIGNIKQAILLVNNSTDTEWFHCAANACAAVCFTRGRIKFENHERQELAMPTQGQAFFYFGDDVETFDRVFADIGLMDVPYRRTLAWLREARRR